jgi:hypothetical protein
LGCLILLESDLLLRYAQYSLDDPSGDVTLTLQDYDSMGCYHGA